jgi:predicted alpha/beta superfamily hydrolase/PKD repeat protein
MSIPKSPLCGPRPGQRQQTISAAGRSNMSHRIDVRLSFVGCLLIVLALLSAQGNVCSAAGDNALLRVHYPAAGHSVTVRGSAGGLSWTVGQPTAASASGDTFTYTLVGLTAPAEWKPLLDDATWSRGPNYHVAPGQTVDVWPHFTTTQGQVVTLIQTFHSKVLGNDRAIYAYLPPSYYENTNATYPVVYMQDGQNLWAALPQLAFGGNPWNVDTMFDTAAEMGTCSGWDAQPLGGSPATCTGDGDCPSGECRTFPEAIVIGVAANNANRIYEYTPTTDPDFPGGGGADSYVQMLADELKPMIDAMLRTQPGVGSTAIAGSSLGGLVSAYAALRRPDVYGLVAEFSPSTWWNNDVILSEVAGTLPAPNRPQIVYVDSGAGAAADQADTDQLAALYLGLGYVNGVNFRYVVQPGAQNSEVYWAERFPGAMQFLLGGPANTTAVANTPPVAKCKSVTVVAMSGPKIFCAADASIDDGSFDPDPGDTITLTQTPAGPYPTGQTAVTLTVTDSHGASDTCTAVVTVVNPDPVVTLTGPASGALFAVNTAVNFTATFTDANGGTHSGTWTFDNIFQAANIVEPTPGTPPSADGSPGSPPLPGSATATYTFTDAGVYSVKLTVNDNCGSAGTANQIGGLNLSVIVYDPSAGFVTGDGWIKSPAGAYRPDPTLTGKANFGFVSKYHKGQSVPTGDTEFQLHGASFDFKSTSYEWLVVSGAKAKFRGSGRINGAGDYGFLLTATDGKLNGGKDVDKLRIKIWNKASGKKIYENVKGSSDDIGGGSVVIQK